ncbi:MAG: MotA/TolQ/ExbB proton channel family protein [Draconibacterium sp.]
MSIFQIYQAGGVFMNFISLMALVSVVILFLKIFQIIKQQYSLKWLDMILLAGSLAVAVGILSQIVGIVQALEAIRAAADISPQIVMGGAIVSFYAPIYGFIVFIFSMIFYFVTKEIIKAGMNSGN